jgi:hypothetical protein
MRKENIRNASPVMLIRWILTAKGELSPFSKLIFLVFQQAGSFFATFPVI